MSDNEERRSVESRRRWRRIGIIGVLLPLLAASILIWSVSGRQSKLDKVQVAVVNNDTIITGPQPMAAGRSLAATLTQPSSSGPNLDWTLADTDDAQEGLRNGTYYAVLTIPPDFSKAILSTGTDTPERGKLQLVSNAAASTTVPYISQQIASAASTSLGNQATQGYLKNVYGGFNQIAQSNQKAATSASELAGGTQQLAQGAAQLDDGAGTLAGSLLQVASGSAELHTAAGSVASGAQQVQTGVAGVTRGARGLHAGAATLAGDARRLAGKSAGFAAKSREAAAGARGVSIGVRALSVGDRILAARLARLDSQCLAAGGSPPFCARLGQLSTRAGQLVGASQRVSGAAVRLAGGTAQLAAGAAALAHGNAGVAAGAGRLSTGSGELSSSSGQLLGGAASLSQGAAGVDDAAGTLAGGTGKSAEAGQSLASGSQTLASSADQTDDGAQQLSSGLAKGAKESPTYSSSEQDALAGTVSEPVDLTSTVQHTSHGNGWLIAAILGVILWLAALVGALSRDVAGVLRHSLSPIPSRRLALTQAVPIVGLALVQAVAVMVAVLIFHTSVAAAVPLALFSALAAVAFSLLAQALRLALGRVGVTLFVFLLIVELAALGNVIPLETAPSSLQTLNRVLPLTVYVNGASGLVSGGEVTSVVAASLVLAVWALGSWAALLALVRRRRVLSGVSARAATAPA